MAGFIPCPAANNMALCPMLDLYQLLLQCLDEEPTSKPIQDIICRIPKLIFALQGIAVDIQCLHYCKKITPASGRGDQQALPSSRRPPSPPSSRYSSTPSSRQSPCPPSTRGSRSRASRRTQRSGKSTSPNRTQPGGGGNRFVVQNDQDPNETYTISMCPPPQLNTNEKYTVRVCPPPPGQNSKESFTISISPPPPTPPCPDPNRSYSITISPPPKIKPGQKFVIKVAPPPSQGGQGGGPCPCGGDDQKAVYTREVYARRYTEYGSDSSSPANRNGGGCPPISQDNSCDQAPLSYLVTPGGGDNTYVVSPDPSEASNAQQSEKSFTMTPEGPSMEDQNNFGMSQCDDQFQNGNFTMGSMPDPMRRQECRPPEDPCMSMNAPGTQFMVNVTQQESPERSPSPPPQRQAYNIFVDSPSRSPQRSPYGGSPFSPMDCSTPQGSPQGQSFNIFVDSPSRSPQQSQFQVTVGSSGSPMSPSDYGSPEGSPCGQPQRQPCNNYSDSPSRSPQQSQFQVTVGSSGSPVSPSDYGSPEGSPCGQPPQRQAFNIYVDTPFRSPSTSPQRKPSGPCSPGYSPCSPGYSSGSSPNFSPYSTPIRPTGGQPAPPRGVARRLFFDTPPQNEEMIAAAASASIIASGGGASSPQFRSPREMSPPGSQRMGSPFAGRSPMDCDISSIAMQSPMQGPCGSPCDSPMSPQSFNMPPPPEMECSDDMNASVTFTVKPYNGNDFLTPTYTAAPFQGCPPAGSGSPRSQQSRQGDNNVSFTVRPVSPQDDLAGTFSVSASPQTPDFNRRSPCF